MSVLLLVLALALQVPPHAGAPSPDPRDLSSRLPDGYFEGPAFEAEGEQEVGRIEVQVVHGFVVHARFHAADDGVIALGPAAAPDDPELRLQGRAGRAFIRVSGAFWSTRAASGGFEGVLQGRRTSGDFFVWRR